MEPGGGPGNPLPSCLETDSAPWTEEPGGLQSMGSQRVRHDRVKQRVGSRELSPSFYSVSIGLSLVRLSHSRTLRIF